MFQDRDDALREMEQALLEEEIADGEHTWETQDYDDVLPEEPSEELSEGEPKQKSLLGLALLALGLMAGIFLLALYWFFVIFG